MRSRARGTAGVEAGDRRSPVEPAGQRCHRLARSAGEGGPRPHPGPRDQHHRVPRRTTRPTRLLQNHGQTLHGQKRARRPPTPTIALVSVVPGLVAGLSPRPQIGWRTRRGRRIHGEGEWGPAAEPPGPAQSTTAEGHHPGGGASEEEKRRRGGAGAGRGARGEPPGTPGAGAARREGRRGRGGQTASRRETARAAGAGTQTGPQAAGEGPAPHTGPPPAGPQGHRASAGGATTPAARGGATPSIRLGTNGPGCRPTTGERERTPGGTPRGLERLTQTAEETPVLVVGVEAGGMRWRRRRERNSARPKGRRTTPHRLGIRAERGGQKSESEWHAGAATEEVETVGFTHRGKGVVLIINRVIAFVFQGAANHVGKLCRGAGEVNEILWRTHVVGAEPSIRVCGFGVIEAQRSVGGIDEDAATVVLVDGGSEAMEARVQGDGGAGGVFAPGCIENWKSTLAAWGDGNKVTAVVPCSSRFNS